MHSTAQHTVSKCANPKKLVMCAVDALNNMADSGHKSGRDCGIILRMITHNCKGVAIDAHMSC